MRYPASEKLEIIRLVEGSHMSARRTLAKHHFAAAAPMSGCDAFVQFECRAVGLRAAHDLLHDLAVIAAHLDSDGYITAVTVAPEPTVLSGESRFDDAL